jgi:hypothetical protein
MSTVDDLSKAWHWAQIHYGVRPEFVQHHIINITDALNRGRTIIPSITFDCHGTLIRGKDSNQPLYDFGKAVCDHEDIKRQLALASRVASAPMATAESLDDTFNGLTRSKDEHDTALSSWWRKETYELLIDDQGLESDYADSYVTVFKPSWNERLITFSK